MSSTGEQKAAGAKGFPAYPEYKDSGIEWLGEVPAHWVVRRLKHVLTLVTDRAANRANPIALENIEGWSGRYIKKESDYSGDGVAFQKGDVLFGKLRPYLAKVYLAGGYGEAVGDFHVMRPSQNMSGRFSLYQFLQSQFISAVDGPLMARKCHGSAGKQWVTCLMLRHLSTSKLR
ncbi:hypothetical protein [Halomonas piscis]|uniref:hypothetical protein n=1 Tax=Halomonas piscis TaxID=3031727 RepID=UPI00289DCE75|nr:hypothetical protein [Halomonas piscis]